MAIGVDGALQKLEEGVDAVLAAAPSVEDDEKALLAFLRTFRKLLNRAELGFAGVAGRYAKVIDEDEQLVSLSPIESLRYDCNMASGAAAAAINIGETMAELPLSCAALHEGRIGIAHLNLISYTAKFVGEAFDEAALLRKAEDNNVSVFGRICQRVRYEARPALCEQEERELHEARFLELTTRDDDGAVWLRAMLDKEGGSYLRTAIESLAQPLPNDDRRAAQRRADALVEIAKLSLDAGQPPQRGGVRPHVQVSMPLETWIGLPGAPPAELEGSGPISNEMMRRICQDSSVRRMVLDGESLVIDVGRERRTFRGGTRHALDHRDRGCVWPGCTRPPRLCQADHAPTWWEGGQSNVKDGRLLCRYHHRLRSEGWNLTRVAEDGGATWLASPPLWAVHSRGWAS